MTSHMERRLNFVTCPSTGDNAKGSNGHGPAIVCSAELPFGMISWPTTGDLSVADIGSPDHHRPFWPNCRPMTQPCQFPASGWLSTIANERRERGHGLMLNGVDVACRLLPGGSVPPL